MRVLQAALILMGTIIFGSVVDYSFNAVVVTLTL